MKDINLNALMAISPIDGRYADKTAPLAAFFSEFGLIKYRVHVEIEYFIALGQEGLLSAPLSPEQMGALRSVVSEFSTDDAAQIKETEATTNHDVKAVEYFVKSQLEKLGLTKDKEFVHFGLTSQDINNTAIPLSLKDSMQIIVAAFNEVVAKLDEMSAEWAKVSMLARTHGQPASPTMLGKEIAVFTYRLKKQLAHLSGLSFYGKFGGATGNFNAHHVAYPGIDWPEFADRFLQTLGLKRNTLTTQIDNYDDLSEIFDNLRRLNVILIDLCRDIWTYISMEYFKQRVVANEVGSSAMPHKVNPIDFENAEGNLGIANAILDHLSNKLPISRLQRDLTDSTVLRNIGVPPAHTLIALKSISKGLGKLMLNEEAIAADLNKNYAVIAEAIQTVLRAHNYPEPYELLKKFTRGVDKIDKSVFDRLIDSLDLDEKTKASLRKITPSNYTGILPPQN